MAQIPLLRRIWGTAGKTFAAFDEISRGQLVSLLFEQMGSVMWKWGCVLLRNAQNSDPDAQRGAPNSGQIFLPRFTGHLPRSPFLDVRMYVCTCQTLTVTNQNLLEMLDWDD